MEHISSYLTREFLDYLGFSATPGGHYLPRYVTHEAVPRRVVDPVLLRPREPSIVQPAWIISQSQTDRVLRCVFIEKEM
jgi:hypothetical protein